eukprot:m.519791 g.519791  ORF g.519791 m.519791 type:complete len:1028 (+) comp57489_c0_seq2:140-3223(+)
MVGGLASVVLALAALAACSPQPATQLAAQFSTGDFPIDTPAPLLQWVPVTADRAQTQTAYQLLVALTANVSDCNATSTCVWDSGFVMSSFTRVAYSGPALLSDTRYFWIVRWWDFDMRQAPDSEVAFFDMALVDSELWEPAVWIGNRQINMMRAEFSVPSSVVQVRCYVSALGWGKVFLSGELLDNSTALGVGWTRYDVRSLYVMYDITSLVTSGSNVVGVTLGPGWKDNKFYYPLDQNETADHAMVLKFQMLATFADGSKSSLLASSPDLWTGIQGPIVNVSIYDGETYDARLEQDGWSTPSFKNASAWRSVPVFPGFNPTLSVQAMPPISVLRELAPVSVTEPRRGTYVVDFGENLSGYCRISMSGPAGTKVVIRHGEVLLHPPYGERNGLVYFGNLQGALATESYIMRGDVGAEVYAPSFTYHGFRYAQIEGYPGVLEGANITMLHVRSNIQPRSTLTTSSIILNMIQYNAVTGQASNLMSVPTDCTQRDERLGWMGDAGLSSDSMAINFFLEAFHLNFLRNIVDEQDNQTFSIPDVVPFVRYGGRPADPSWSAAFTQIIWTQFNYFNDIATATLYYPHIMEYLSNLAEQVEQAGGLENWPTPYGDWYPPSGAPQVPGAYTSAFSYLTSIAQTLKIAETIGQANDTANLQALFAQVSHEFNSAFMNGDNYVNGVQTAMALPLVLGIVEAPITNSSLLSALLNDIEAVHNYHVTTGIIGFKGLMNALADFREWDIALALAEQVDYPSLGWMVFNGIEPSYGSLWEIFDGPAGAANGDSRNHHMFSSPSLLHFELAGLTNIRDAGFAPTLYLTAALTQGLSSANLTVQTPRGLVAFSWQRFGGTQCGKSPQSHSPGNLLPVLPPLTVTCSNDGSSKISKVVFASYGLPNGYCGAYSINETCHAANSTTAIEQLCLQQSSCSIPANTEFWGNPCLPYEKRLVVQVQCSEVDSIVANVSVPVGVTAAVSLPKYGITDSTITESGKECFRNGVYIPGVEGVASVTMDGSTVLTVQTTSGSYYFALLQTV